MDLFKNFIFVTIIIGVLTRVTNFFFQKDLKRIVSAYLSFFLVGIIVIPIATFLVGFDVAASEYLIALIIWLIFDLIRSDVKKKKKNP